MNDMYKRVILDFDFGDAEMRALMVEVWRPTPFMVDALTDGREREIKRWLHDRLGGESHPTFSMIGNWHYGCVTMCGRTWIGFNTQEHLDLFNARFPEQPKDTREP